MARISQYKSLGKKLGGYKATQSKVQSLEYAKRHADWKAGEQKALYGQIGGSIANIIGIAQEKRLAREQSDMMAREFGIDPGGKFAKRVTKEGKKDNPWLNQTDAEFWAEYDAENPIKDTQPSKVAQPSLFEGEPGETSPIPDPRTEEAYQESLKRFSPSTDKSAFQLESEALRTASPKPKLDYYPTQPIESEYHKSLENVVDTRGVVPQKEPIALSRRNFDENIPSSITDDMAFDVLTDTTLGDFNSSKDDVIKQARAVGGDRADELEMVFGMESSYGQDPKAKGNILQIKNKGLLKEAENIDLGNPTQVANFYVNKTSELTKDFREYKVQGGDLAISKTGKTFDIFGALESEGIDESGTRYLTWQQGRAGVADIATALETGKIGKKTVENMLNNLSEDQKKSIIAAHGKPPYDDTKLLGFSKKSGTKNFIQAWLKIQSTKMKGYKR